MEKQIVEISGAGKPELPFSPAVMFGAMVFVSGQIGNDGNGRLVEGGFAAQVRRAMQNVQSILEQAGSSLDHLLKVTVYLADFDRFAEFNELYCEFVTRNYPARTTFQVGRLGPGVEIEIDAIAYVPSDQA